MIVNEYFVFNQTIVLTAAAPVFTYQHKMRSDFYLFDLSGATTAAIGVNVNLDITNQTQNKKLMSDPCRAGLCVVPQPGDSSWLHPVLLRNNDVVEVVATLAAGAPNVTWDLSLLGFNHAGGVPEYCAEPKQLYFYVWDFGNFVANQRISVIKQIVKGVDFIGLGWVATGNASALNTIEYRVRNVSAMDNWMSEDVPGAALFPNFAANMRRVRFRLPQLMRSEEVYTIDAQDVTGGAVLDVAVAMYGYHQARGL